MNILEKFRSFVGSSDPSAVTLADLKFTKHKKEIVALVFESLETGTVMGMYCPAFGQGMFLVAVEKFYSENEIVFYRYDSTGVLLLRNVVSIEEIKLVCPFPDLYAHPLVRK